MAGQLGAKDLAAVDYRLPSIQFNPINPASYFSSRMPNITIDTQKQSKAQGFKSIMEAISQLPEKGMKLYADAKKVNTDLETRREYDKALKDPDGKDSTHAPLSDFKVSGGNVTLDREDPEVRELKISEAKARKSYWDARAAGNDPDTETNPLFGSDPVDRDAQLDYDETKPTTGNPIIDAVGRDVKKGGKRDDSCWDWAQCVYKDAGAGEGNVIFNRHPGHEPVGELDYNQITPGSWLWVHNGNKTDKDGEHSVIFMDWLDKEKGLARVASGSAGREPRIETYNFNQKEIRRVALPQYTGAQPEPGGLRQQANPAVPDTLASNSAKGATSAVIDGATVIEDNNVFRIEEKGGYRYTIPKRLPKGGKGKLADYIKTEKLAAPIQEKQTPTENALDRAIIQRGGDPTRLSPEAKADFLQKDSPLKPSEKIAALRDLKDTYQKTPSTVTLFGSGQMPGIDTIKERLDALLGRVDGDFAKLSPTEQRTFIYQFSKLNDPNSAVMLGEYQAAADTLGLGERAHLALNKAIEGQQITPEQASEIYQTITATHERMRQSYIQDVAELIEEGKVLGVTPTRLGIPKKVMGWLSEAAGEEPAPNTSINRSVPGKPAAPAAVTPKATNPIAALQQALQSGKNPDGTPMSDADRRAVEAALKLKSQ